MYSVTLILGQLLIILTYGGSFHDRRVVGATGIQLGKPEAVPSIKKCDFQKDYKDGRDEVNCTRHPFVIPPKPSDLADHWAQVDIWSKVDLTGRSALFAYRGIGLNEEDFHVCRVESNNDSVFIGKLDLDRETFKFDCYYLNPYAYERTPFNGSYEMLLNPQRRELTWKKSTAGHIPQGAIVMGMTPSFQLIFLCRIPEIFLYRELRFPHSMIGTLSPGADHQCVFTHPHFPHLRDYEVLVDPSERTVIPCGQTSFNCSNGIECISSHYICDGESDCKDGSDEEIPMCGKRHGCNDTEFPCSDGKCLPMSRVCEIGFANANRNCFEGNDESKNTVLRYCNTSRIFCNNGNILDVIRQCNAKPDCGFEDSTDEANCSRYWGESLATPAQLEERYWKRGHWSKNFKGKFSKLYRSYNVTSLAAILRGTYYYRRAPSAHNGFMYSIFNSHCSSNFHCTYFSTGESEATTRAHKVPFQVLQESFQERYEWVKNFKGRIPDGAVMWGLTLDYEPTFICQSRYRGLDIKFEKRFVGILVPSKRKCYFGEGLGDFLDYQILRDIQFHSGSVLCGKDTFNCSSHSCVPMSFVCDGQRDCDDGSDENITLCREKTSCSEDEFPCSDGKCIPVNRTCQAGRYDAGNCIDQNDESESFCGDRPNGFKYREFQCKSGEYIEKIRVCDYMPHCADGSDEMDCDKQNCTKAQFACSNGICLNNIYKCDGYFHCNDGTDEKRCEKLLCRKRMCYQSSNKIDRLWWKRGLWVPYKPWWKLHYVGFQTNEDDLYLKETVYICRLLDSTNGSSRIYLGTLEYERTSRRHICSAKILDGSDRIENFPFQVLMDDSGGGTYVWQKGKKHQVPYGSVVGGVTEEHELFFICRATENNLFVGSFRPRIKLCAINEGSKFEFLRDSRFT